MSIVICVMMVTPIVLSISASLKTTEEAAAVPPTYFPSEPSTDNYQKLWDYGSKGCLDTWATASSRRP
ncbi:MAG TPA: hypothetical protein VFV13_03675 [Acidimicrobiia bacterium]|nr:hypothetical protein [Acidimicrobiia bacterium]